MQYRVILSILLAGSTFSWAQEKIDPAGVPNFHVVNEHLYRGAQPTSQGFKNLAKLGVKTVIDLREESKTNPEEKLVVAAGMKYVNIRMRGLAAPTDEQIHQVFALLENSSAWPVFVHCKRGADRTGTVIACYRISHDHWATPKALTEAQMYGMSWVERAMRQYILNFSETMKRTLPELAAKPAPAGPGN